MLSFPLPRDGCQRLSEAVGKTSLVRLHSWTIRTRSEASLMNFTSSQPRTTRSHRRTHGPGNEQESPTSIVGFVLPIP